VTGRRVRDAHRLPTRRLKFGANASRKPCYDRVIAMSKPKRPPVVLLVVAAALVVGIGAALWRYGRFNDVHVVNGFSVPLDVTIDGVPAGKSVSPDGHVVFEKVSAGTHVIEAKHDGSAIETTLVFVKGGGHDLVYNPGGAAPVVWEKIAYTKSSTAQQPQWTMYCGSRFIEVDGVDYAFVEPPRSISTKGGGTVYKTHLTVDQGGLKTCQSWALDKGTPQMWADWQLLEAKLDPTKALYAVDELARQGEWREAQLLLEARLEKQPSLEVHRLYQSVLIASGQRDKALAKYRRDPADVQATDVDLFLAARPMPAKEKLAFLEQALARFPDSAWLHWQKGSLLSRQGDSSGALAEYALAAKSPPEDLEWSLYSSEVAALLRVRRLNEAWALGDKLYRDSTTIEGAVTHARLAAVTGNGSAKWDAKLKPHQVRWVTALLGGIVVEPAPNAKERDPESYRKARELMRWTLEKSQVPPSKKAPAENLLPPQRALASVSRSSDSELRLLPGGIVWLLLTEAWRTGDTLAAARLSKHAYGYDAPRHEAAMRFIATGERSPDLDAVSDVDLAVLWLARGRRLAALGLSPKTAYDEARRLDAFHAVVWRALETWPEPKVGAKLAWLPVAEN
jgi:tetratricopeptide (TPR) repeat protein